MQLRLLQILNLIYNFFRLYLNHMQGTVSRLRRFLKKTETENGQEKTEKPVFLSVNNTETKISVARAVAHLHVFLLGYEL